MAKTFATANSYKTSLEERLKRRAREIGTTLDGERMQAAISHGRLMSPEEALATLPP